MEKLRTKVLGSFVAHVYCYIIFAILSISYEIPSEAPFLVKILVYNDNYFERFIIHFISVYIFVFAFYFIKPLKERSERIAFWIYNIMFFLILFQPYIVELVFWIRNMVV